MNEPATSKTLDTLLDDLINGRAIALDGEGGTFRIESPEARSVLIWYRDHRDRWAKNTTKEDVEAIVDHLDVAAPAAATAPAADGGAGKHTVYLKAVRAFRFGGIHRFGSLDEPPDEFYFEVGQPFCLVEGANGAGKTSLLSAILWCLTGYVYCPLRAPELATQSVPVAPTPRPDPGTAAAAPRVMSPITPMPPADVLTALGDDALPLDTWVELELTDEQGDPVGLVRRRLQRGPHGSVVMKPPDLAALGLDTLTCEVGTRMPGLLPYVELGATSDLGSAVAALIGIKPLQDLARHAQRVHGKLTKDLPKERATDIRQLDADYGKVKDEFQALLTRCPSIAPNGKLPDPGSEDAETRLTELKSHFETLQAETLAKAQEVLGTSFDSTDASLRDNLMKSVGPALGLLDVAHISGLPSARRLAALLKLSADDLTQAEALIERLQGEAREIDALSKQPALAQRLRLYARVAGWMKDHPGLNHAVETCPVCQRALESKADDVSGRAVEDHLREFLTTDALAIEKTAAAWEKDALSRLRSGVCPTLQAELNQDLPPAPADLIKSALGKELFGSHNFQGCLAVLQPQVRSRCDEVAKELPPFAEPAAPTFAVSPAEPGPLTTAARRLTRAVAFARWRKQHDDPCREAFARVIGQTAEPERPPAAVAREVARQPLREQLLLLDRLVKTAEPIHLALSKVEALADVVRRRRVKNERQRQYARAADAVRELLAIPTLVETQVASLTRSLADATAHWKSQLYSPAFVGAPCAVGPEVAVDGAISVDATADGAQAAAQHVGNTAELRATLFAFLIAFWNHLLDTRGGLALLLLDDPQELFDRPNRRRVAKTIPLLAKGGATVIATTLDHEFGRQVDAAAARCEVAIDRRRIHPTKAIRPHIVLGPFVESVEEKRRAFERPDNENEAQPARDYVKELRIYIENRLVDFFDLPEPGLPKPFSLSDLIGAVRSRVNSGIDAFADPAFKALVSDPALAPGSDFLALLNESHHGNHDRIQYVDVVRVREHCARVVRLVMLAHEAYERWLRRDRRESPPAMPEPPAVIQFPLREVPLFENLAAFTAECPPSAPVESDDRYSTATLTSHALYVVCTNNLGFAGQRNCRAIVDLSDDAVGDNRLVIALHGDRVYARRLFRDANNPSVLTLGSDAVDPTKRPPSVQLPAEEVRLLKVVGILFDHRPQYPRPTEEATPARDMNCLDDIEIAFRVRGESAEPLALPGQIVLGGQTLSPEDVASMEGTLVAVATAEGAVFKRVGRPVPGAAHLRHLEAIGGYGESMLVRLEELDDDPYGEVPLLRSARAVLGVLYE